MSISLSLCFSLICCHLPLTASNPVYWIYQKFTDISCPGPRRPSEKTQLIFWASILTDFFLSLQLSVSVPVDMCHVVNTLKQWFSKCGLWTSSISITWGLVRNENYQWISITPELYRTGNSVEGTQWPVVLTSPPGNSNACYLDHCSEPQFVHN